MYLIIFEDGSVRKMENVSADEIETANDRYCEIIDISDPLCPIYYDPDTEEWERVKSV